MEKETIEPKWIELENDHDGYTVTLRDEDDEEIETHRFGTDLLGAVIRVQQLQSRMPGDPSLNAYIMLNGFPRKHPNQTTLGN